MNTSAGRRRGAGVDECECGIMFLLLVNKGNAYGPKPNEQKTTSGALLLGG